MRQVRKLDSLILSTWNRPRNVYPALLTSCLTSRGYDEDMRDSVDYPADWLERLSRSCVPAGSRDWPRVFLGEYFSRRPISDASPMGTRPIRARRAFDRQTWAAAHPIA